MNFLPTKQLVIWQCFPFVSLVPWYDTFVFTHWLTTETWKTLSKSNCTKKTIKKPLTCSCTFIYMCKTLLSSSSVLCCLEGLQRCPLLKTKEVIYLFLFGLIQYIVMIVGIEIGCWNCNTGRNKCCSSSIFHAVFHSKGTLAVFPGDLWNMLDSILLYSSVCIFFSVRSVWKATTRCDKKLHLVSNIMNQFTIRGTKIRSKSFAFNLSFHSGLSPFFHMTLICPCTCIKDGVKWDQFEF